uniref:Pyrrolo-quinoline quinone repeat domain-containing protein n=1 Tax=Chenopodium quinoa TaxID=63459 RepID=A0A803MEZ3_CHEQI
MRYASKETKIGPKTVQNMKLKWIFEAQNDITATPAIYNGILYFPSWDGYIYAVKASSGSLVWKQFIQDLTGIPSTGLIVNVNVTVARATPTVAPDLGLLIVGLYGPCYVLGLRINDGSLAWMTKLDAHIDSLITMSGTYSNRAFYVGVSSLEEERSIEECCHFRGSFVKIDAKTGVILWKTYMLPNNNGQRGEYAGAAIWGSSPPIDVPRKLVYIATGNLYSAPQRIRDCSERENNQTFPTNTTSCVEPENHSNSFLALDLDTGNIKWYHQIGGYDVWFFACHNISSSPDCPPGPNPDADFGEAPMLLTVKINSTRKDIAVATQKSGFTWALDRDTGDLVWSTNFILSPSNKSTTAGGWVAMEASTGKVLWSLGNPSNASTQGPVTVANGVVFAGSTNNVTGPIYAIDAKVGNILWSYDTGATIYGGVSVSDGCIYVGHGYKVGLGSFNPAFSTGKSLFCFCVD